MSLVQDFVDISSVFNSLIPPFAILLTTFLIIWLAYRFSTESNEMDKRKALALYFVIGLLLMIGTIFLVTPSLTSDKGIDWVVGVGQLLLVLFAFITISEAGRASKETSDKADESIRASQRIAEELAIDRRIEHLNRMLGQLYSPFLENENRHLAGRTYRINERWSEDYHKFFDQIRANAYLAGDAFRGPLHRLLEADSNARMDEFKKAAEEAIMAAKMEYSQLIMELELLTRQKV